MARASRPLLILLLAGWPGLTYGWSIGTRALDITYTDNQGVEHAAVTGKTAGRAYSNPGGDVKVQYLGTGGVLIERDGEAIATAPFFSNNSLFSVGLGTLDVRKTKIDLYCPNLANVKAILVGHAHYDHLLDVPYIWSKYSFTTVYGNQSAFNILQGGPPRIKVKALTKAKVRDSAALPAPQSVNAGAIEFTPIASSHAPNFRVPFVTRGFAALIARWDVNHKLSSLPRRARGWRLGQTLAFDITMKSPVFGGQDFRIYYQDAGHIPESYHNIAPGQPVDLAIITVASSNMIDQELLIKQIRDVLKPKHWMLIHWEDFFHEYSQRIDKVHALPTTDPADMIEELEAQGVSSNQWVLPLPGVTVTY